MATQVQWRGGSTAEHSTFTGAAREVTVDTQKKTLVVHDGSTAGGEPLLREDQANLPTSVTNGISVPTANNVAISTNGTGKLFVDANGNVGVDTSGSFDEKLFVNGNIRIGATKVKQYGTVLTGTDLAFETYSGGFYERLRITSDGKLGLGTSDPSTILTIAKPIDSSAYGAGTQAIDFKTYFPGYDENTVKTSIYSGVSLQTPVGTTKGYLSFLTHDGTSLTEKLRIEADGKVGIGVTDPVALLQPNGTVSITGGSSASTANGLHLYYDTATNTGNISAFHSGVDNRNLVLDGKTIGFTIAGSDKAKIDGSGRLLVGTSSARDKFFNSSNNATTFQVERVGASGAIGYQVASFVTNSSDGVGAYVTLGASRGTAVNSYTALQSGDIIGQLAFQGADGTELVSGAAISAFVDGDPDPNDDGQAENGMPTRLVFSTTADGASSPTPWMTITSAGNLLVNTPSVLINESQISATGAGNTACFKTTVASNNPVLLWNSATSGDNIFASFFTETSYTSRGTIDYNRAAGQVRYNTTSDQRLKSNIHDAQSSLNILGQIKVRSYDWTETGHSISYGFVAQELHQAVPDAVKVGDSGNEVINAWAVDNSKLVPLLTKALQEAIERIEQLETEMAAVKAQLS